MGGRYTQDKRHGTLYTVNGKATAFLFNYDNSRFDPMVNLAYDAGRQYQPLWQILDRLPRRRRQRPFGDVPGLWR